MGQSTSALVESISSICDNALQPALNVNSTFLAYGSSLRQGLSAKQIAANVISRQQEFHPDMPGDKLSNGDNNLMNKLITVMIEEIIKAIQMNARVDIAFGPNSIVMNGTGGNAGGPVSVISTNPMPTSATGIIR